jgi:hypothetical protein
LEGRSTQKPTGKCDRTAGKDARRGSQAAVAEEEVTLAICDCGYQSQKATMYNAAERLVLHLVFHHGWSFKESRDSREWLAR